jgi:hypothetical protein
VEDPVKPAPLLALRLWLMRRGPALCLAVVLLALGLVLWAWLLPQRMAQAIAMQQPLPAPASLVPAPPPPSANENLALFYQTLGERRYAEQQVRTLFGLAAKTGLSLRQGEYRFGQDRAAGLSTYQITLPVRGPYQNIWQFALQALAAMPFAALDEISLRREAIGDPVVEARLRFTLYLKEQP